MLLDDMLSAVKDKHDKKPISAEAYHRWRRDGVTRRLMEELETNLIEMLTNDSDGNPERMLKEATVKQATKETCEGILNWKPVELESDDS